MATFPGINYDSAITGPRLRLRLALTLTTRGSKTTTMAEVPKCAIATIEIACARWQVGNTCHVMDVS